MVPACARGQSALVAAQLLRVGGHAGRLRRRAGDLQRLRGVELGMGSGRGAVLLAPVLLPPAGPQLRRAAGSQRDVRRRRLLAGARRGRPSPGRGPLPVRTRGVELREPAGDPGVPLRSPASHRRDVRGPDAPGRGEPVAGGRRGLLRERRPVPHGVPLPADAADVHGEPDGGPVPADRHPEPDARDPRDRSVGDVPAEPRRADARDGDRRGARLHVPRLRRGPAGPREPRDPSATRAAARQRPTPDRADERAAVLAPRHAGHLLRRRDRDGRQHLPRRSERRPHADAVEPGPQRGVLGRQPAAPLPAARRRPGAPPLGGQRRGAAEQPVVAAVVDAAPDRGRQALALAVARRHRVPLSREPQGRRVPAHVRRRPDPGGREPLAERAVRGAGPLALRRPGPRRAVRADPLPPDRTAPVLHHARAVRLLLVPTPARRARGRDPLLPGPHADVDGVLGRRARPARASRPGTIAPPLPGSAALVRREGPPHRDRDDRGHDPPPRRRSATPRAA